MVQVRGLLYMVRIKFVFIVTQAQMESVPVMMMTVMESRNFSRSFLIDFSNVFFVLLGLDIFFCVCFWLEMERLGV